MICCSHCHCHCHCCSCCSYIPSRIYVRSPRPQETDSTFSDRLQHSLALRFGSVRFLPPHAQRALLEFHLRREHAQLESASSTRPARASARVSQDGSSQRPSTRIFSARFITAEASPPARRCTQNDRVGCTNGDNTSSSSNAATNSVPVDEMRRETSLKRSSRDFVRQQAGNDREQEEQQQQQQLFSSSAGHPLQRFPYTDTDNALQLHLRPHGEETQNGFTRPAFATRPAEHLQAAAVYRVSAIPFAHELRPSFHEPRRAQQPFVARPNPPQPVHGEDEIEQARRQVIIRQVFDSARPPARARRGRDVVGSRGGDLAQRGGAPSFTVGGSASEVMRAAAGGEQGFDQQGAGLRRADLLRRILHAMRCVVQYPCKNTSPKGNMKLLSCVLCTHADTTQQDNAYNKKTSRRCRGASISKLPPP